MSKVNALHEMMNFVAEIQNCPPVFDIEKSKETAQKISEETRQEENRQAQFTYRHPHYHFTL